MGTFGKRNQERVVGGEQVAMCQLQRRSGGLDRRKSHEPLQEKLKDSLIKDKTEARITDKKR